MLSNLRAIWALVMIFLAASTLGVMAEENALRDKIISGLSQGALGTKKPTVPPTKKPTKATVSPTIRPTKATVIPTLKPTKKAASPTKATTSPTKKNAQPTYTPTKKAASLAPTKKTKPVTPKPSKKTSIPTAFPVKKTNAPVASTSRPTKRHSAPTAVPTKKAAARSTKKSISPTLVPTKKADANGTKKTSSAPTSKSLKDALTEAQLTPSPTSTATEAPTARVTTSAPTDPVVITLPVDEDTAAPTGSSGNSAETPSPTNSNVIITLPEDTEAPSTANSAETTPSPTNSEVIITLPEDTASPTATVEDESSPEDETTATETPASATEEATDSPSSVGAGEESGDQATDAPTESGSESKTSETTAPTSEGNGTITEGSAGGNETVIGSTSSPTAPKANANETTPSDDNSTTTVIAIAPSLNGTSTEAPTSKEPPSGLNDTSTESPSATDLKTSILSTLEQNRVGSTNWTEATLAQLWLVRSAGITSRSAATSALLAAQRACAAHSETAQAEVTNAIAEINGAVLPQLKSNRTACDELMKEREAEDNRKLREQLEFASASCSRAIRSHEHLVELLEKVANGTLNGKTCEEYLNEQTLQLKQYDVQTEADEINTTNTVLAAIGVAFGFIFLIAHPLPNGWGTVFGFVIAAPYTWAYFAFLASWYAFNLSEPDAWLVSTWWRSYYSTYLLGLAAWLLLICLTGMLYMIMVRNPWFLGIWAGISMGGILGVQVNTIGMWQLGYDNNLPPYYTLACCIGSGLILMAIILAIASAVSPTMGAIQHWCIVWIGSYLFVKSIGVLVGSYPNEFDMAPPIHWENYLYISCMWVLAILVFVMQMFLYGINRPLSSAASNGKRKRDSTRSSQSMTVYGGGEEKVPLIESPGSASDARNMARQQEVSEFGGVRALRPDSENRRLFV